ncbi:MAG: NADH:ubiquinone oxidoreductase subunit M [Isosphaeraceae bacterium]|jgi:NADH-quinone oxidoreductase subunit M|nr:MAG: NADH:ubiquinone oxidoreductase subunit M [Isosphaeraceae bacterium]
MSTLLAITVFLPLLGALILFSTPGLDRRTARQLALMITLGTLALTLILTLAFDPARSGPQFAAVDDPSAPAPAPNDSSHPAYGYRWLDTGPGSGIRFALGLDGLSLVLFALTALLMVPSVFASWNSIDDRPALHYALMLLLETGLLGLFAALDVILFYVFFEFTLIPLFFLIGLYGGPERRRASVTFFLYTLAGSLLTLLGVIALVLVHQQFSPNHTLTFSIPELTAGLRSLPWSEWSAQATSSWTSPQALIFLLLFAGFAIKVPIFPFHTWLPLAHVEAPTAGSILLAGVLLKVGGYGFLRFNLAMTPHGAAFFVPLLATLSVLGILHGALTALAQSDVKRLVAYSSVSHMGFVTLGLFTLSQVGLEAATIQMINHGLTTGALFACIGILYERYHTRDMAQLGGLWSRLPLFAFFLILACLGSAAVPGLNGFVGEFPILLAQFARDPVYAILASLGMILGAYYLLMMIRRLLFGPLREPSDHSSPSPNHTPALDHHHHHHDHQPTSSSIPPLGWHEIAGLVPLMIGIVAIGLFPQPIFDRISPSLREIATGFANPSLSTPSSTALTSPTPPPALSRPSTTTSQTPSSITLAVQDPRR